MPDERITTATQYVLRLKDGGYFIEHDGDGVAIGRRSLAARFDTEEAAMRNRPSFRVAEWFLEAVPARSAAR